MKTRLTLLAALAIYGFTSLTGAEPFQSEKMIKLWELKGLSVPESVLPVSSEGIMYVSNIGTSDASEKEGKGFISLISMEGKIINLKWVTGLNSPKGMALVGDKLYVTEVDRIAEIDIKEGKKLLEYPVQNAVFLNDITADEQGNLYISDSRTGTIYRLSKGVVEVFVQSDKFTGPNGVIVEEGRLFLGTGTEIVKIDLETREIIRFIPNTGGVDGLALIDTDKVIFSDWPGTIHRMERGKEMELLLDTRDSETAKTADFGFEKGKGIIYVPTFFNNSVAAYQLLP